LLGCQRGRPYPPARIAISGTEPQPDDVAAFATSYARDTGAGTAAELAGSALAGYRRVVVADQNGVLVAGVERRSWAAGTIPQAFSAAQAAAGQAWQLLADRPRTLAAAAGVQAQLATARSAVELVGPAWRRPTSCSRSAATGNGTTQRAPCGTPARTGWVWAGATTTTTPSARRGPPSRR
jgi:hypothetical protein